MTYGIAIKNNTNAYAIDGANQGISFRGKYTTASIVGGVATFNLTGITGCPIVFAKTTDTTRSDWVFFLHSMTDQGAEAWTVKVGCGLLVGSSNVYPSNIIIYVFHPFSSAPSGYGIIVKKDDGQIVFNSTDAPLILSGYHVTSAQSGYDGSAAINPSDQPITRGSCSASSAVFCPAFGGSRRRVSATLSALSYLAAGCSVNSVYFRHSGVGLGSQPLPYSEYYLDGGQYLMFINTALYD